MRPRCDRSSALAPAEQQDAQDLLGRVGRRADRIRAEDRERLGLAQALADLLLARQRPPEHDAAHAREGPAARCRRRRWRPAWRSACPVPVYRKYGACGRSTRTRRSPGLRPRRGRRPPITWTPMWRYASDRLGPVGRTVGLHGGVRRRCGGGRQAGRQPAARIAAPTASKSYAARSQVAVPAVEVDDQVAGPRVAVARLPDAARVEQRPALTERDGVARPRRERAHPRRRPR